MLEVFQFGPTPLSSGWRKAHRKKNLNGTGWNEKFHRYQMEWSPELIQFSVDEKVVNTVYTDSGYWAKGDFDKKSPDTTNPWINGTKEFYFIFNVAVGGTKFFSDAAVGCLLLNGSF